MPVKLKKLFLTLYLLVAAGMCATAAAQARQGHELTDSLIAVLNAAKYNDGDTTAKLIVN